MERLSLLNERTPTAGTVPAFRVASVPVRLHFTFVLLLAFLIVTDLGHESSLTFALYLTGLFVSLLVHELAHAGVAAQLKVRTLEIVMFPIGGLSRLERRLRPTEEILVTLAGPLANLAIAGAIFGYMAGVHEPVTIGLRDLLTPSDANVWQRIAFANLLAAALNLVPAFPMDGGRVLRAFMSMVRPEEEATRVAAWMGRMLAISMGLYGLVFSELLLVFFAFFVMAGRDPGNRGVFGPHAHQWNPGPCRDDHGVSQAGPRRHGAGGGESAALYLAAGFPHHARRSGDRPAGSQSHAEGARRRRPRSLRRDSDGTRLHRAGSRRRPSRNSPLLARAGRCALVMDGARMVGLLTTENLSEFLLLRRFGMEPAV